MINDKRTKAHTRYRREDGTLVPGVTTVIGILDKPALVGWANRMGLEGVDTSKYVKVAADVGTICHGMIEAELKGYEFNTEGYAPKDIAKASAGFIRFLDIVKDNNLSVIESEMKLVDEVRGFGGTCDIYCVLNGKKTLVDIKTSKGVYDEMKIQVAAYKYLLEGAGHKVEQVVIARVGKEDADDIEMHYLSDEKLKKYWLMFTHCLQIYALRKELSGIDKDAERRRKAIAEKEAKNEK